MKTTLLIITVLIAAISCSLAGGNTSSVDLDKVISIKIEDQKITIGYQREKMTLTSVYVTHIVGSGSLSKKQSDKGD